MESLHYFGIVLVLNYGELNENNTNKLDMDLTLFWTPEVWSRWFFHIYLVKAIFSNIDNLVFPHASDV